MKQEDDHCEPSEILLSQLIALGLLSKYIRVSSNPTELTLVSEANSSNGRWHAHDVVKPLVSLDMAGKLVVESPGIEFRATISEMLIRIREALIGNGIDLQTLNAVIKPLDE